MFVRFYPYQGIWSSTNRRGGRIVFFPYETGGPYLHLCQSCPKRLQCQFWIAIKGGATDSPKRPPAALKLALAARIFLVLVGAVPVVAITLDRQPRFCALHGEINTFSRLQVVRTAERLDNRVRGYECQHPFRTGFHNGPNRARQRRALPD